MLRAIEQAGPGAGLPSRKLGEDVFNSHTYGWKILKRAEQMGYIKRKKVPRQKGQGGGAPQVLNYLTPKGRKLLKELGQ